MVLQRWETALRYNAEVISSMLRRSSPEHQIARFRLASTYPLRRLGRLNEALEALSRCHDIFESEKDFEMLGKTFGMLAGIEGDQGHYGPAIELQRNAIRYNYTAGNIDDLYADHHNMAVDLAHYSDDQASAGAHFLIMALICMISGHHATDTARGAVANHFFRCGGLEKMTKIWQLKRYIASSAGVNIDMLLRRLGVDTTRAQQILDQLVNEMPTEIEIYSSLAPFFVMWEPVIAALLAADQGNTEASEALDVHLAEVGPQWAALANVVRRIRTGERTDEIADGLRAVDKIIAERALGALTGRTPGIQAGLWPALALDMTMTGVVFATLGENSGVQIIRESLKTMPPFFAPMAHAIEQILRGERGAKLSRELTDPFQRLVIETILMYCAAAR